MKAIGIARQSHGDGASVEDQTARIREHAKREGWALADVLAEQDVSGGSPLTKRPGLLAAVEAVEQGRANIIVVAYFDRLVRSMKVQIEVLERVEKAGGRIVALDTGEVSSGTASKRLTVGFLGQVAQYHREATSERVKAAHESLRAQGRWTGGKVPFYRTVVEGVVTLDQSKIEVVREAFEYRLTGRSVADVLTLLRERTGLPLKSLNIAQRMLRDESLVADGVVSGTLYRRCQELVTKRGARPQSDRLLARLGLLKCGVCGGNMNVHGSEGPTQVYRCHRGTRANPHTAISVKLAEDTVAHEVRCALRDFRGGAGESLDQLEDAVRVKGAALERIVMAFDGMGDVDAVRSKLAVAKGEVEAAEDALAEARAAAGFTLSPSLDWSMLGHDARRDLIASIVSAAAVSPGSGTVRQYLDPATGDKMKLSDRLEIELQPTFQVAPTLDAAARTLRDELAETLAENEDLEALRKRSKLRVA